MPNEVYFLSRVCLILLLCGFLNYSVQAQSFSTKNGLYSTYQSFLAQKPLANIQVLPIDSSAHPWVSTLKVDLKAPLRLKKRDKSRMKDRCWGISDGQHIYINSRNFAPRSKTRFCKILYLGIHYSYFIGVKDLSEKSFGQIGGILGEIGTREYYLIDMQRGEAIILKDKGFEEILSRHPKLYQDYQATGKKLTKDEKMKYIEKIDQSID